MSNIRIQIVDLVNEQVINKDQVKSLLLPCFNFSLVLSQSRLKLSKIGGYPIISDDNINIDDSLSFLGQISLKDISSNGILPNKGILYFFININLTNRFPERKGDFKVLYLNNDSIQYKTATNINSIIPKSLSFSYEESYSFPSYQESIIENSGIKENDLQTIEEITFSIYHHFTKGSYDIPHQILGHPQAIQGTVRFWWAAKYLGMDKKDYYSEEEIKIIEKEEDNFILLLQVNFGDLKINFDNFDDSLAYFGIHKRDLEIENFNNVVLVMQNT